MTANPATDVRAVLYLRQSLDATGDQLAVQRQREACQRIARERGWTVAGEYVDNSISASDRRKVRPGYDRLVADYAADRFDAIIVWDLDRLTRQPRQLEDWIDAAEGRGLRLVTANGEADLTTDGGRMYARIKAAVAKGEVERKGARQRAAAAQRADQGRPPLGPPLTGYTSKGEIVEDEAARVKELFERFAAGDSLKSLAAWLADTGAPTRRGGKWNPSSVSTILKNPRYAGRAVYDGRETGKRGAWTPIIDEDTFAVVASRLRDPRRRTAHGTDRKHLGGGLYLCGAADCGRPVVTWSGSRYRCPDGHVTRSRGPVDRWVLMIVLARLARRDLADLLPKADPEAVKALDAEASALRRHIEAIESDYDDRLIDGRRYQVATAKAKAELADVENRRRALGAGAGAAAAILTADDPVAAFEAAPLMLQRAVIDTLYVVRLHSAPRGSRTFKPETVQVDPR